MPHPLGAATATALAAGIAAGLAIPAERLPTVRFGLGLLVLLAAVAHRQARTRVRAAAMAGVLVCAGTLHGAAALDAALHPSIRTVLDARLGGFALESAHGGRVEEPIDIEGRLREDASVSPGGARLRLDVTRAWLGPCPEPVTGGLSLGVVGGLAADRVSEWTAGRTVRAPVLLRRPSTYRNHGLADQERALARRGISLVGTIKSAALVSVTGQGRWWQEWGADLRARTRDSLARHLRPHGAQSAAVATAVLVGDRASLNPHLERRLQEAGTYHVIAISGGNIAVLSGLVLGVCAAAGWRGRGATAGAIVVLIAYGAIAEGGASVVRATAMAVVYLGVRLLDLQTPATNALALVAAGVLLVEPLSLTNVGFWLTFAASAAIVLSAEREWRFASGWRRPVLVILQASIAVEAVLLPIAALVFERVTLAGLLLNFVAIPSMTIVQVCAMGLVAADWAGSDRLAGALAAPAGTAATLLIESSGLVDLAPWLTWRVPSPSALLLTAYYLAVAAWWWVSRQVAPTVASLAISRTAGYAALTLGLLIAVSPQSLARAFGDGRLHVTMFDVGQGDAMLVTFPNGRRLTVDAGGIGGEGAFDIGDRVLGPALRARGVRGLDYVAVTHGDADHVGGAAALVHDFSPSEVWVGVPVRGHEPTAHLADQARRMRAGWRSLQRGDRLDVAGVELRVLHPPPPEWERQRVRNDDSLVLELRFGNTAVVLAGDIGREVEHELVPLLEPAAIRVLKVAHHGSNTSSSAELLEALRPTVAMIGVGRGNTHGHPAPAVLARYRDSGTALFRTDEDGEVSVTMDGERVSVSTFSGRRFER